MSKLLEPPPFPQANLSARPEQDEVQFFDYLLVLWKRKFLVLGGTIAAGAAIAAFVWTTPPVFETTLNLQVGRIWSQPIESLSFTSTRISSEPFLQRVLEKVPSLRNRGVSSKDILQGRMTEASVIESAGLILLRTRSQAPQEALDIANAITEIISAEHRELFDSKFKEQVAYQNRLEKKLGDIERENERLGEMLTKYREDPAPNPLVAFLVQAQVVEKESSAVELARELHQALTNNNSKIQTDVTRIVDPALLPLRPEARGLIRSATVGAAMGFVAFSFLAFFLEFIKHRSSTKRRIGYGD